MTARKGTDGAPTSRSHVDGRGNAGWPTGREPQGHGGARVVVGATPEPVESFRIALSLAAQRTIAISLWLLGVSAPESM